MAGEADLNQKDRPGYEGVLSDRVLPFPTLLRAAGYHTYIAGKWHLGLDAAHGPQRKGFERSFVLLPGGASHFADATGLTEQGERAVYQEDGRDVALPAGFYSTASYTDKLIDFIRGGLADGRPFFAYAAYTSPHWPLQVPDAELDRYRGVYDDGYDVLRARRFEGARRLGVVPADAPVPARTPFAPPWDALSPDEKRRSARRMELYAAMVENLDHHVGRLLQFLKDSGHYDDTLILFLSDNGPEGNPIERMRTNAEWIPRRFDNSDGQPRPRRLVRLARPGLGAGDDALPPLEGLPHRGRSARAGDRALRRAQPARHAQRRVVTVKDVAPTLLELAGVPPPRHELRGPRRSRRSRGARCSRSWRDARAPSTATTSRWAGSSSAAARCASAASRSTGSSSPTGRARWELFDLAADPLESSDLASARAREARRAGARVGRVRRARGRGAADARHRATRWSTRNRIRA